MSDTPIQETKNKLGRIYGVGLLAFTAIIGSITVLGVFLARLDVS